MDTFFSDKRRWTHLEVADLLVSHNALTSISKEDALEFAKRMRPSRVKEGTVLFREGEKNSTFMIFILQGEAIVESGSLSHNDSTIFKVLGEGDLIGELGIIDNRARAATVTAVSEIALAVMDQASFAKMISEKPALACSFLGTMLQSVSNRLRESNHRVRTLNQINKSLTQELAAVRQEMEGAAAESTQASEAPPTGNNMQIASNEGHAETRAPVQPAYKPSFFPTRPAGAAPDVNIGLSPNIDFGNTGEDIPRPDFSPTFDMKH